MSLSDERLDEIGSVSEVIFNGKESYKVIVKLKKPLFSSV